MSSKRNSLDWIIPSTIIAHYVVPPENVWTNESKSCTLELIWITYLDLAPGGCITNEIIVMGIHWKVLSSFYQCRVPKLTCIYVWAVIWSITNFLTWIFVPEIASFVISLLLAVQFYGFIWKNKNLCTCVRDSLLI